jgi:hypothetical protein
VYTIVVSPAKNHHLSRPCECSSILIFLQTRVQHVASAFCVCFEQLSDNNWSNVYKVWVVTPIMRRFRYAFKFSIYISLEPCFFASKKSDGKRTGSVLTSDHEQNLEPLDVLPQIPLTNDFRSSLILPECAHSLYISLTPF